MAFFYIIKYIGQNQEYHASYYAGMSSSNSSEFMTKTGYCTTGSVVLELISQEGIESFTIEKIRLFDSSEDAYDYETRFLNKVDARNNIKFMNFHNNEFNGWGSPEFYEKIRKLNRLRYGVDYPMQREDVKKKSRETNIKNLGVEYPMQSEEVKNKSKSTCMSKYGFEYSSQSEEIRSKVRETNIKNLGVEYPMQSEEVVATRRLNNLEKYGYENPSQRPEHKEYISNLMKVRSRRPEYFMIVNLLKELRIKTPKNLHLKSDKYLKECMDNFEDFSRECIDTVGVYPFPPTKEETLNKTRRTNLERYGHESWAQTTEGRAQMSDVAKRSHTGASAKRRKETNLERYGSEYNINSDIVRDKMKKTTLERYGVEKFMQSPKFIKKREENNIKKYGVAHHQQTKEWKEKMLEIKMSKSSRDNVKLLKELYKSAGIRIPAGLHMKSDDFIESKIKEFKIVTF